MSKLRGLVVIKLKSREVVGANPELYGCGNVIDVCGDVEDDVCEWGTAKAENLNADGLCAMGGGGTWGADSLEGA